MVKHTQTIPNSLAVTDELSEFDHFVGLAIKRLNIFQGNIHLHFSDFLYPASIAGDSEKHFIDLFQPNFHFI